jgi:uncharacterized HAD superfamily protein|tara:strand:+ start:486 stop:788 length:303 start_codon:yes stop_codon:yes gene_type:complete
MRIYVDIDDTICDYEYGTEKLNYNFARPIQINIDKINKLYDEGNQITYYTARGSLTGIDWYEITKNQIEEWGCKYHLLSVGEKPPYDLLICDKTKRIEEI